MPLSDEAREIAEKILESSVDFSDEVLQLIILETLADPDASAAALLDAVYLDSFLNKIEGFSGVLAATGHLLDLPEMIESLESAQGESGSIGIVRQFFVEVSFLVGSVTATALAAGTAGAAVSIIGTPFAGAVASAIVGVSSGVAIALNKEGIKEFLEVSGARPLLNEFFEQYPDEAARFFLDTKAGGTDGDDLIISGNTPATILGRGGNDTLEGGDFNDILDGGPGNDSLRGGAGEDTAVFEGNRSDYGFSSQLGGGIGVSNFASGETDVLFEVERIQFADMVTDQFGNEIVEGPIFPEGGVSDTISLADAVGAFGAADGSEVAQLFLEALGATVDNVTYAGSENAAFLVSKFEIPGTPINYQGGIMLSSGGFPGPSNTSSSFTVGHFTPGDSDLDVVAQQAFVGAGQTQDASVLEFSIFVDDPSRLSFDLVFGSDEYPEFANSSFVDVAAVFVNGENVALFPGSDEPLSITNENVLNNLADNRNGVFATEWDGFAALGLTANLDAGWNDIKIGVADTGDNALDTAIYLTDFELTANVQDDDGPTGEVRLKNVGGPLDNSLVASNTPEEHTFYEPSSPSEPNVPGSLSGTASSFNNDVVTNFKSDDEIKLVQLQQIELLKQAVDLLQQLINIKKGSAIVEIDEDLDGSVDSVLTLEGDFENSRFDVEIVEDDVVLTLQELGLIEGTEDSDYLRGTDGADALRTHGGSYDKVLGGADADQFIFGAEANNGVRERDVILDYEVGMDAIVLEDGASVASMREGRGQVVLFLEGDGDAIYVRGDGVTADNLTIVTEDFFQIV